MLGRIFMVVVLLGVVSLAIMFDWFGAQSFFKSGVEMADSSIDSLASTGDKLKSLLDSSAD